jgi:hypothetical protein
MRRPVLTLALLGLAVAGALLAPRLLPVIPVGALFPVEPDASVLAIDAPPAPPVAIPELEVRPDPPPPLPPLVPAGTIPELEEPLPPVVHLPEPPVTPAEGWVCQACGMG